MQDFNWDDMNEIKHAIKAERTVILGAIQMMEKLKRSDIKLRDIEDKIDDIILRQIDD